MNIVVLNSSDLLFLCVVLAVSGTVCYGPHMLLLSLFFSCLTAVYSLSFLSFTSFTFLKQVNTTEFS